MLGEERHLSGGGWRVAGISGRRDIYLSGGGWQHLLKVLLKGTELAAVLD